MGVIADLGNEVFSYPTFSDFDNLEDKILLDVTAVSKMINDNFYEAYQRVTGDLVDVQGKYAAVAIFINDLIWKETAGRTIKEVGSELDRTLHKYGTFYDYVTDLLSFKWSDNQDKYIDISTGWRALLDDRITLLEDNINVFDQDTIDKLTYVADHYDDIKALVENDIETIIATVEGRVMDTMKDYVDPKIADLNSEIDKLWDRVETQGSLFYRAILQLIEFFLLGLQVPQGDIEDVAERIQEWIADEVTLQLEPFDKRIKDLEGKITGEGGLTEKEVRDIVAEMLEGLEGIAGPQGPVGPPGPAGPIGPAGPAGDVELDIAKHLDEINRLLYNKLTQATGITTTRLTGVVDWILSTYGERFAELSGQITPISEFLTGDMRTSLTGIVEAFGTPEALISFILDVEEGDEDRMLDLMQILITMTFERGLI